MPNSIFPVPPLETNDTQSYQARPSLLLRTRTRWARRRLDEELALGANPAERPDLKLRASQLCSSATRAQFAHALVKTLTDARRPEPLSIRLHSHRAEIRDCADDLLALALRLLDGRPIDVRGAAMTARLLTVGESPLDPNSGESLRHAVRSARLALDGAASTEQEAASVPAHRVPRQAS